MSTPLLLEHISSLPDQRPLSGHEIENQPHVNCKQAVGVAVCTLTQLSLHWVLLAVHYTTSGR